VVIYAPVFGLSEAGFFRCYGKPGLYEQNFFGFSINTKNRTGGFLMRISSLCLALFLLLPATLLAAPAEVPRTGQTTLYVTGDDGDLEAGAVWPDPRFSNNGDGTITDNLTGLIWLSNANCFGDQLWSTVLNSSNALASGTCGLADGSVAGNWRLPNITELESLVDAEHASPALPDGYLSFFAGVQSNYYWSSGTFATDSNHAWMVSMINGGIYTNDKSSTYHFAWPVRGGQ
jgi:hypothetical protein